jgi:hypothetical protein
MSFSFHSKDVFVKEVLLANGWKQEHDSDAVDLRWTYRNDGRQGK